MMSPKFLPVVAKHIARHRVRTLLTLAGVATAMFLFCAVQAMHAGVTAATRQEADDATLVVYRENRYCPFTSRLPEDYTRQIAEIPGVRSVVPVKILVNNCRASLDVVTFRGVPPEDFESGMMKRMKVIAGSVSDWKKRGDGALVGARLAERRSLKVGDRLVVGGVAITVSGVVESDEAQDQNVAYTHLEFLQRAQGAADGVVTQFNVTVDDPSQLDVVAAAIDEHFKSAQDPTSTWSEKAFTARAVTDVIEIVNFARWLGWGSLAAVFALVANAIILSVQERIRDHAVLQTLGYTTGLIARMIIAEGALLSLAGGAAGLALAMAVLRWGTFTFTVEGLSVNIEAGLATVATGLGLCLAIGLLAGLFPAWQASRREISACFRAV